MPYKDAETRKAYHRNRRTNLSPQRKSAETAEAKRRRRSPDRRVARALPARCRNDHLYTSTTPVDKNGVRRCPVCHAARLKRQERPCSVSGCPKVSRVASGLCPMHYRRVQVNGDPGPVGPLRVHRPVGHQLIDDDGYVLQKVAGRRHYRPVHRLVMEAILGRPLLPGEEVHHRNGIRDDNAPSNLELWVKRQPAGQRAHDLVEWARVVLQRYEADYVAGRL